VLLELYLAVCIDVIYEALDLQLGPEAAIYLTHTVSVVFIVFDIQGGTKTQLIYQ